MRLSSPLLALCLAGRLAAQMPEPNVLQIRVLQGEGAVHPAGGRSNPFLRVQVTDETGKPVPGTAVTFRLPEDGPGGVFTTGLKIDIVDTGEDGSAPAPGVRLNPTAGAFEIRVVAVKGKARAGTVVAQYSKPAARPPSPVDVAPASRRGSKTALLLLLLAAGAGGGVAVGLSQKAKTAPSGGAVPTQVGAPAISIGNP